MSIPDSAVCIFMDGKDFCCVLGSFVDLQESPAGFGETPEAAFGDLLTKLPRADCVSPVIAALADQGSPVPARDVSPEAEFPEHGWTDVMPDKPGLYENRCDESGGDIRPIEVFLRDGEMIVDDPDIGESPLPHYHDSLTNLEWRRRGTEGVA